MHVRPIDPQTARGLIDPDTKRLPFVDTVTGEILESVHVPETSFWVRRLRAREIALVDGGEPTGLEPIAPLTTR